MMSSAPRHQQMPLEVECVVDCCMRLEKALPRCSTLDAPHLSLAPSNGEMREHFFNIAEAECEAEVEPNGALNHGRRKAMRCTKFASLESPQRPITTALTRDQ